MAVLAKLRAAGHDVTMPIRLPIENLGDQPLELRVLPFLFADIHGRYDYLMPPGARWLIVSDRNHEVGIEAGYGLLNVLVHGGVDDIVVSDEDGVAQDFADPPLGCGPPGVPLPVSRPH
jgi:hypothetical protein